MLCLNEDIYTFMSYRVVECSLCCGGWCEQEKTQVCERSGLHLPDKLGELISSIVHVFPSHTKHKICHNLVSTWGIKFHRTTKVNVLKLLAGPVSMVTTLFALT